MSLTNDCVISTCFVLLSYVPVLLLKIPLTIFFGDLETLLCSRKWGRGERKELQVLEDRTSSVSVLCPFSGGDTDGEVTPLV